MKAFLYYVGVHTFLPEQHDIKYSFRLLVSE